MTSDDSTPSKSLYGADGLASEPISQLLIAASDITLLLDEAGLIQGSWCTDPELRREANTFTEGRAWIDTVMPEGREKIEELLSDAISEEPPRWRQVTHPFGENAQIPVSYTASRIGDNRLLAVGRSLLTKAQLQQQLVSAQQSIDRDYSRLRQAETRYRMLFRLASEAVIIVDADTLGIVEANPAAEEVLGKSHEELVRHSFPLGFSKATTAQIRELLNQVRTLGETATLSNEEDGETRFSKLSASLFIQEGRRYFLVRLSTTSSATQPVEYGDQEALIDVVQRLPDAFVVTNPTGTILAANQAFLELVQVGSEARLKGADLARWFGRSNVDLNVLLANLRQHGVIRNFATTVQDEFNGSTDVEISAVAVTEGDTPCFGFCVRSATPRPTPADHSDAWPRSAAQITELVGRLPLRELVRESTGIMERLCIETALKLTNDNRASAAEILGLSRQGLYAKLRRHGIGGIGPQSNRTRAEETR